jgi:hypothetical protein
MVEGDMGSLPRSLTMRRGINTAVREGLSIFDMAASTRLDEALKESKAGTKEFGGNESL